MNVKLSVTRVRTLFPHWFAAAILASAMSLSASASKLCVNPNVKKGCFSNIGAAVAAASPGDTSNVAPGTYNEDVAIGMPLSLVGAGAGVGLFADGTGIGLASRKVVSDNVLRDNGIGGVVIHIHVGPNFSLPADDFSNNFIVGNQISGNGADLFDTATPGPDGINVNSGFGGSPTLGTVIAGNVIDHEAADIAVNTRSQVDAHLNNLFL